MIKSIVAIIFIIAGTTHWMQAQTIKVTGKIVDGQSAQGLPYASVYINQTTIGTYANEKGEFTLLAVPIGTQELMASYVGYQPSKVIIQGRVGEDLTLQIGLKLSTMKAIEITAKRDDKWFEEFEKFKKLFLGQGQPAKLCHILNPFGLTFTNDKNLGFVAHASQPLEVDNLYLGYRVHYDLTYFAASKQKYSAKGYIRFEEMQTTDTLLAKKWTQNRRRSYAGSVGHFLSSITDGKISQNGYETYDDLSSMKEIVRLARFQSNLDKTIFTDTLSKKVRPSKDSSVFHVKMPKRLEIHYKFGREASKIYWDVSYPVSWIEVNGGDLILNRDGTVLNPIQMTLSGQMLEARVAQLLPNNYRPKIMKEVYQAPPLAKAGGLNYLSESAYLHTDRSYYYPGESLWFKAYIKYGSGITRDSLSKVLYIDLVNSKNVVAASKAYEIRNDQCIGDIELKDAIQPGDYTLRAYTRWMLNFDTAFVYRTPVKILSPTELVRPNPPYKQSEDAGITITSMKEEYFPRERVELSVDVLDEFDNRVVASLSLSVTDLNKAWPAKNEKTILKDFNTPDIKMEVPDDKVPLTVQRGFDLGGTFISSKRKKTKGVLTFVQTEAGSFEITTEDDGHFFIPDLLLFDTAKISYAAKAYKGKPGSVVFDSVEVLPKIGAVAPLSVDVFKSQTEKVVQKFDQSLNSVLLKSVTIEARPVTAARNLSTSFDYEVTGEWLRARSTTDVLSAMQTRVPGLRIIIVSNDSGFPERRIQLSGISSIADGTSEPIVVMDGQVLNGQIEPLADQISRLTPDLIENIEITKYGNGAAYGMRGANGVIVINTRRPGNSVNNNSTTSIDDATLKNLKFQGFSNPAKFVSPDYSNPETPKEIPDNRSTIFWNPSLMHQGQQSASVTFYAADLPTSYRVVVEGVTSEGKPIRGEKIITIKKNP